MFKLFINLFLNKSNLFRQIKNYLIIIIIFTILFSLSIMLEVFKYNVINKYVASNYDFYIGNIDKAKIKKLEDYVGSNYKGCFFMQGKLFNSSNTEINVDFNYVDDFKNINLTNFADDLIINEIPNESVENPIYIDWKLSKALNANVGDVLESENGKMKKRVKFTVARIYETVDMYENSVLAL